MTERKPATAMDDDVAPVGAPHSLQPQAAAELAQELTLVSAALFTQLEPGSAAHALSGVPGIRPQRSADVSGAPTLVEPEVGTARLPVQDSRPTDPAPSVPVVPLPVVPSVPVGEVSPIPLPEPPAPVTPVALPSVALVEMPVPVATPVAEVDTDVLAEPVHPDPPHSDNRSMLMLDEISFLDEDT